MEWNAERQWDACEYILAFQGCNLNLSYLASPSEKGSVLWISYGTSWLVLLTTSLTVEELALSTRNTYSLYYS